MSTTKLGVLPERVQSVFDTYLDEVDRVLYEARVTRVERRGICDEVEAHARELLAEQISGAPTPTDAIQVIATMAHPTQFVDESFTVPPIQPAATTPAPKRIVAPPFTGPQRSTLSAVTALLTILTTSSIAAFCIGMHRVRGEEFLLVMLAILVAGGLASCVWGWQSLRHSVKLGQFDRVGFALFGIALVPAFLATIVPFIMIEPVVENVFGIRGFSTPFFAATFLAALLLTSFFVIMGTALIAAIIHLALIPKTGPTHAKPALQRRSVALLSVIKSLCVLQMVGAVVACVLALIQTETIVASGPILSLVGIAVAILCVRAKCPLGILFGLSAPAVSLLCVFVIAGFSWGPREAHLPIGCIGIVYCVLATALGLKTLAALGGWSRWSINVVEMART